MPINPKQHKNRVWYAFGTHNGERIRRSLKTRDKQVAEEQCALLQARLWKRDAYGEEAVRTFEEAALSYMDAGHDKRFIAKLLEHFRGRRIGDIKPGEIKRLAQLLYPEAKPPTWNRQVITPVQAIINHASQLGWCQPIRVSRYKVDPVSRQVVDRQWVDSFMQEAYRSNLPHLAALALFMFQVGRPVGDVLRLTWDDVDLSNRTVAIGRSKTRIAPKPITISQSLRIALANLPRCPTVFKYPSRQSVYGTWKRVCLRAGVNYVAPHQAGRHSAATHIAQAGINPKAAMETIGFKNARHYLETYVHPADASNQVADMWDGKISAKSTTEKGVKH